MGTWGLIFVGVIALSSLIQAVFLVGLALQGRKLARRLDELHRQIDRELRPGLEQFRRIARNFSEISDLAVLQARRADALMADTIDKIEETTGFLKKLIIRPLGPLADVVAFLKGVKRGLEVYRQLSTFDHDRRAAARRYAEDEHLFI